MNGDFVFVLPRREQLVSSSAAAPPPPPPLFSSCGCCERERRGGGGEAESTAGKRSTRNGQVQRGAPPHKDINIKRPKKGRRQGRGVENDPGRDSPGPGPPRRDAGCPVRSPQWPFGGKKSPLSVWRFFLGECVCCRLRRRPNLGGAAGFPGCARRGIEPEGQGVAVIYTVCFPPTGEFFLHVGDGLG